jgi:hypothetical protein
MGACSHWIIAGTFIVGCFKAVEWKRIVTQLSPPDERSTGAIAEGWFCVRDGEVYLEDAWRNYLGTAPYKPGDDAKAIAQRLLRQKTGEKWSAFYNPIQPPPRSIH